MVVQTPIYFNFARDVMERQARERPDACALWCVDESGRNQRKFSFRQLAESFRRAAGLFHAMGIRRGDRVLTILPRIPQWWIAILGLTKLGAVPSPGTPFGTSEDIRYHPRGADALAITTDTVGAAKAEHFGGGRLLGVR